MSWLKEEKKESPPMKNSLNILVKNLHFAAAANFGFPFFPEN